MNADQTTRSELSFDGVGINGPDEYRSRVAVFPNTHAAKTYGRLFEAAPDLLAALKADHTGIHAFEGVRCFGCWAIEKAEGGSK